MRPKKTFMDRQKVKKASKKPKSIRETAKVAGVPKSSVHKWKQEGAPTDDVAALGEWIAQNDKRGHDPKKLQAAKLGVLRETERRLKIANDAKQRMVVDRAEVEGALQKIIPRFFDRIETAFAYELPPALAGKSPEAIATICREIITKTINQAKAEMQEIAKA